MNQIQKIKTKQDWFEAKEKNVVRSLGAAHPTFIQKAKGAEIWDIEGKRFIDFSGGIAVMNLGHSHPKVLAAVKNQIENFQHSCFPILPYTSYIELAEKMNALVPGDFPKKTFLVNAGVEAVENAVKIAKMYTKRRVVLCFSGAFHGRSSLGMALTGKLNPYKAGFFANGQDIYRLPFPNPLHKVTLEDTKKALASYFKNDFEPSEVAAIIIEPVQGEGGYIPASKELLIWLRSITQQHGIVLIIDEVQSGFGRCGKFFAIENHMDSHSEEIGGDIYLYAKSFAAGFPLSGLTGRAEIMDAPPLGALGSTYGGNPVGIAAALAVIETMQTENLMDRSANLGKKLTQHLQALQKEVPTLAEVRGLGSMIGAEFFVQGEAQKASAYVKEIIDHAYGHGLMLLSCGSYSNTIRFMYPISIEDQIFNEALGILTHTLKTVKP